VWILAVIAGLLLFAVLVLAVPVDLTFQIRRDGAFSSKVRIGWLFNRIGRDLTGRKEPEKTQPARKRPRAKPFLAMVRSRGFLRRLLRYLRDVLRAMQLRELEGDLRVGLSDPADTGMLFALIMPVTAGVRAAVPVDVRIRPDFQRPVLQGYLNGDLRVVPIRLLAVSLVFACSPATLRGLRAMVVARRR
jgi:hypothetical protein